LPAALSFTLIACLYHARCVPTVLGWLRGGDGNGLRQLVGSLAGCCYPVTCLHSLHCGWPQDEKVYVELYATKRTKGRDSDLSTKLLASEK